ncbi:MAG: zinc-binding dehydrogenase [Phycisphaeraceae bacterium]|nr:zinc-binding dehydrogenase [Phycisphaeraceae bacterium]
MSMQVVIPAFGGVEVLEFHRVEPAEPPPGQVRVRLTSIGMNHADLMARRGHYKLSSGPTPFTPGLEGGGIVDRVGDGVTRWKVGDRVLLDVALPRLGGPRQPGGQLAGMEGTYRTHYFCDEDSCLPAPANLPDEQLGCVWLAYLTAWGCLVWKHGLDAGGTVTACFPAASSPVAMAGAQLLKALNPANVVIGLTRSPEKRQKLSECPEAPYDHLLVTRRDGEDEPWHREVRKITDGRGVDIFFDPVAAGSLLNSEIVSLAEHGTIYIYGLLGKPAAVDLTPLIRKHAAIRGWALSELTASGPEAYLPGCRTILDGLADGRFKIRMDRTFSLREARQAQAWMEQATHLGKLALIPDEQES